MRADVDAVIAALADPTRRRVVQLLRDGPMRAGELARAAGVSAPAMSRHLRILLRSGVLEDERRADDARLRVFRLRHNGLDGLRDWVDAQLASYQRHVERTVRE
ncbi:MAG TPA: metalloregulator ArsR/SmtB family transcription factor [Candidatus Limnocylindria bacterium]|nr:metalloregulator ArsR/SmtB family transcription factor [Candidatus Limnocylindria bacterium]